MAVRGALALSERVEVFSRPAGAALRAKEHLEFAVWAVLRASDPEGRGLMLEAEAAELVREWRRVKPRQAEALLRRCEARGYLARELSPQGTRFRLAGAHRILAGFDLPNAGRPHVIPLAKFRRTIEIKAELYATVYPVAEDRPVMRRLPTGGIEVHQETWMPRTAPLTRGIVEQVTGVPERTQRRYDRYVVDAQPVYAVVEDHTGPLRRGEGYFAGTDGKQRRRLADVRTARNHLAGSRSAARHASRKLQSARRRLGRRDGPPCGHRPCGDRHPVHSRSFFGATTESAARRASSQARPAGRIEPRRPTIVAWKEGGGTRWVVQEGHR